MKTSIQLLLTFWICTFFHSVQILGNIQDEHITASQMQADLTSLNYELNPHSRLFYEGYSFWIPSGYTVHGSRIQRSKRYGPPEGFTLREETTGHSLDVWLVSNMLADSYEKSISEADGSFFLTSYSPLMQEVAFKWIELDNNRSAFMCASQLLGNEQQRLVLRAISEPGEPVSEGIKSTMIQVIHTFQLHNEELPSWEDTQESAISTDHDIVFKSIHLGMSPEHLLVALRTQNKDNVFERHGSFDKGSIISTIVAIKEFGNYVRTSPTITFPRTVAHFHKNHLIKLDLNDATLKALFPPLETEGFEIFLQFFMEAYSIPNMESHLTLKDEGTELEYRYRSPDGTNLSIFVRNRKNTYDGTLRESYRLVLEKVDSREDIIKFFD